MTANTNQARTSLLYFRPGLALLLVLLTLCTFWAVTAPFIAESNGGIVLVLLSLVVAWLVVSRLVIDRWGGKRLGSKVVVVAATPLVLFLLWRLEMDGLVLL